MFISWVFIKLWNLKVENSWYFIIKEGCSPNALSLPAGYLPECVLAFARDHLCHKQLNTSKWRQRGKNQRPKGCVSWGKGWGVAVPGPRLQTAARSRSHRCAISDVASLSSPQVLNCFLIDNNGFILISKRPAEVREHKRRRGGCSACSWITQQSWWKPVRCTGVTGAQGVMKLSCVVRGCLQAQWQHILGQEGVWEEISPLPHCRCYWGWSEAAPGASMTWKGQGGKRHCWAPAKLEQSFCSKGSGGDGNSEMPKVKVKMA